MSPKLLWFVPVALLLAYLIAHLTVLSALELEYEYDRATPALLPQTPLVAELVPAEAL